MMTAERFDKAADFLDQALAACGAAGSQIALVRLIGQL
jgi:hypothetical protein